MRPAIIFSTILAALFSQGNIVAAVSIPEHHAGSATIQTRDAKFETRDTVPETHYRKKRHTISKRDVTFKDVVTYVAAAQGCVVACKVAGKVVWAHLSDEQQRKLHNAAAPFWQKWYAAVNTYRKKVLKKGPLSDEVIKKLTTRIAREGAEITQSTVGAVAGAAGAV